MKNSPCTLTHIHQVELHRAKSYHSDGMSLKTGLSFRWSEFNSTFTQKNGDITPYKPHINSETCLDAVGRPRNRIDCIKPTGVRSECYDELHQCW